MQTIVLHSMIVLFSLQNNARNGEPISLSCWFLTRFVYVFTRTFSMCTRRHTRSNLKSCSGETEVRGREKNSFGPCSIISRNIYHTYQRIFYLRDNRFDVDFFIPSLISSRMRQHERDEMQNSSKIWHSRRLTMRVRLKRK